MLFQKTSKYHTPKVMKSIGILYTDEVAGRKIKGIALNMNEGQSYEIQEALGHLQTGSNVLCAIAQNKIP